MTCGICIARRENLLGPDKFNICECIRERHQFGPHIFKDDSGQLVAWELNYGCDCCTPTEEDRCYIYWLTDQTELQELEKQTA